MQHSHSEPLPRYENAIVVSDAAAEALAAVKIYGRALVGGEIPGVEKWHPTEKILACTSSDLPALARFLQEEWRRLPGGYLLLADNGEQQDNPATMRAELEKTGCAVQVLDITGESLEVVARVGALYGREQAAQEFAADYCARLLAVKKKPPLPPLQVLVLLGIKHPVSHTVFCLAATQRADVTREVLTVLGCDNPVAVPPRLEAVPGMMLLTPERLAELVLSHAPDAIALTGDETAAWEFVQRTLRAKPSLGAGKVFRRQALVPLPWYCSALVWRLPEVLATWYEALETIFTPQQK